MRFCILLSIVFLTIKPGYSQPDTVKTPADTLIAPKTISIIGVGDIMPGTNYPSVKHLPPNNNPYALFENVVPILSSANLTIGNLEGCLSDNAPVFKTCKDTTKCYLFRIPTAYGQTLKDVGFDVLTIANNHSGDFGDAGRQSTVNILNELGIYHAGWIKYPTAEFTKDSIRYGIASFAPNSGTVPLNDIKGAMAIVADLKSRCDIVIVTFHGGAEGKDHQHITRKAEDFYGENRGNVYEFARKVIDAGADVVFGHGPHVVRAIDIYKNRFIAYSLGNFCTYDRFNLLPPNNIAPMVKININQKGEFLDGQIISAIQVGEGVTITDPNKPGKAVSSMRYLTQTDIPELKIVISDEGFFKNPFCE